VSSCDKRSLLPETLQHSASARFLKSESFLGFHSARIPMQDAGWVRRPSCIGVAYSLDLGERVVGVVASGMSRRAAALYDVTYAAVTCLNIAQALPIRELGKCRGQMSSDAGKRPHPLVAPYRPTIRSKLLRGRNP
jgi:hypothetical protein